VKRFSFNLEKVLQLRKHRERETEIELGRAIALLQSIEARLAELALRLIRAAEGRFDPGHDFSVTQDYNFYILRLETARDRLLEEAAQAEARVEEARGLYLEASRDRKALDKLKELRQKEHRREHFAEETRTLDDLSGGREARRPATG
jgi:flagellar FliJ protein